MRRLILSASAWGRNPDKDAIYLTVTPSMNDGAAIYKLNVKDVPVDAFWSVIVYTADGHLQKNQYDAYSLNSITAKKSDDGSVAIQFGGCDSKIANCLPIMPGWNYMVRLSTVRVPRFSMAVGNSQRLSRCREVVTAQFNHERKLVMKTRLTRFTLSSSLALVCAFAASPVMAQKYKTDIPPAITAPESMETRIGILKFDDGFPDDATVQKVYDNLDFQRGVQAFLNTMPAASLSAMREGLRSIGVNNSSVAVFESLMDSKSLFLTANTESVYLVGWLDLKDGPMVIESPPNVLGFVDDFWFHFVTDMGNAGRDQGKGGKYLILPPDYKGEEPAGYLVSRSATYGNWFIMRGFLVKGDPKPAVASFKQHMRLYPLAQAANPPTTTFINASGKAFNTIHAMDFSFYEEVNKVIQEEPNAAIDPETLGLLASIGIEKGKPFVPDARMKKILVEAANVGNTTTRTLMYRSRDKERFIHPDSGWVSPPPTYTFEREGVRLLDTRSSLFFYGTGITPAMVLKMVGVGSQYAFTFTDAKQQPLDGDKSYRLHLPPNIPAKDFWSLVIYDNQTRSELQTDQQFPSTGSQKEGIAINADTSVDVYFGPKPPPGKGWNVILRLYGPLQPWFDKTWRPGEIEEVQ